MQLQLPFYDYDLKVSQGDKVAIEELVETALAEFKGQKAELEELALECITNISDSSAISAELSDQSLLKRVWGGITGKNRKMRDALNRNTANTQYAQQQMLTRMLEQNATIMGCVAAIHQENHTITLEIKGQQLETNKQLRQVFLHLIEHRDAVVKLNQEQERLSGELDHVVFICPECKSLIARKDRVCYHCGCVLNPNEPTLTTQDGTSRFQKDLAALSAAIKETQSMKNVISESKQETYQRKMRKIRRYIDQAELPPDIRKNVLSKCTRFEHFLEKQHIEVAIAGTVKAGKSMLINALLETDLAAVDTIPETSVLAKYRTTGGENYVKVNFYSAPQWDRIWVQLQQQDQDQVQGAHIYLQEYEARKAGKVRDQWVGQKEYFKSGMDMAGLRAEVDKFTSSKSPVHFFVREVEVGLHSDLFPHDVYLVDTPGLDDAVEARSNVTREYLDKADAVLACIKEKSIHEASEAEFISRVMANRSEWKTLFVVATQKDLDKPSDFQKNRTYFINNILGPLFDAGRGNGQYEAGKQFFGISALLYVRSLAYERGELSAKDRAEDMDEFLSLLSKYGFATFGNVDWVAITENMEKIKETSGVPRLKQNLEQRLFGVTRQMLYAKMEGAFQDFQKQIYNIMEDETERCGERLEVLTADQSELQKKRDEVGEAKMFISRFAKSIQELTLKVEGMK